MVGVCPICGKEFKTNGPQRCCSRSCAAVLREENKKIKRMKLYILKETDKSVETKNRSLIDDAKKAEELGMSYGQYQAMKYMVKISKPIDISDEQPLDIVHCKDCIYYKQYMSLEKTLYFGCSLGHGNGDTYSVKPYSFCYWGKRKEN